MTTEIISNGSKWAGEPTDPIESLIERLKAHPLNWVICRYGVMIRQHRFAGSTMPAQWRFHGNFFDISAVFQVYTTDRDLARTLARLILANTRRLDYRAQRPERPTRDYLCSSERRRQAHAVRWPVPDERAPLTNAAAIRSWTMVSAN